MKEVDKLERTHPQSPDYSVQLNYLQTMLSLPWGIYTTDNLNLVNAEKTLNKDHYGLEKVKERILEHLAVLKLKGDMKSPIICLYGSPGVGKTSLGVLSLLPSNGNISVCHWVACMMKQRYVDIVRRTSVLCRDVLSKV